MNQELLEWMRKEDRPTDDSGDWTLFNPDLSIAIWKAMQATSWRHLPFPGGLLQQPDWLIHDLYTLSWRRSVLRDQMASPTGAKPYVAFGG